MISEYSVFGAVLIFNLYFLLLYLIRKNTPFLIKCSVEVTEFIAVLALLRLCIPYNNSLSFVIRSYRILPWLKHRVIDCEIAGGVTTVGALWTAIWIAGIVVSIARELQQAERIYSAARPLKTESTPQLERIMAELQLPERMVVRSGFVRRIYTVGIFRPIIFLPDDDFTDDELRWILRHEMQHVKYRDNLRKALFQLVASVFWFNPLMYYFRRELDFILELRCDLRTVAACTQRDREDYLRTILKAARYIDADKRGLSAVSALSGDGSRLVQRFQYVLGAQTHKCKKRRIALILLAVGFFVGSYFISVEPGNTVQEEQYIVCTN